MQPEESCSYAKEYITSLEFLRDHKEFSIQESDARNIALQVSHGCTGAARRLIKIVSILIESGAKPVDAITLGVEYAQRTDIETDTYIAIFLKCFLSEDLDLNLGNALKIAKDLSSKFNGDLKEVRRDFNKIIRLCMDINELGMPRPECAFFAAGIAKSGEKFKGGVADIWMRLFNFIRSKQGPQLTTPQAILLSETLLAGGKDCADNFIQAFKYGVSSRGLKMSLREAIEFGKQMTLGPKIEPTSIAKQAKKAHPSRSE